MAKKQKYFEPDSGLMVYKVVNVVNDSLWFQYRLSSLTLFWIIVDKKKIDLRKIIYLFFS